MHLTKKAVCKDLQNFLKRTNVKIVKNVLNWSERHLKYILSLLSLCLQSSKLLSELSGKCLFIFIKATVGFVKILQFSSLLYLVKIVIFLRCIKYKTLFSFLFEAICSQDQWVYGTWGESTCYSYHKLVLYLCNALLFHI